MAVSSQVISATDVLLALLYAKGSTGKYNEPISGTTKLEKFMYILNQESDLQKIIEEEYKFVPDNFGPCAHEIFDDIEMLKDANIVKEESKPLYTSLDEGDTETSNMDSMIIDDEHIKPTNLRVFSLTEKGEKIGSILFKSMNEEEQNKITILKKLFNKRPVSHIVKYVYEKYPHMIGESIIRDSLLY